MHACEPIFFLDGPYCRQHIIAGSPTNPSYIIVRHMPLSFQRPTQPGATTSCAAGGGRGLVSTTTTQQSCSPAVATQQLHHLSGFYLATLIKVFAKLVSKASCKASQHLASDECHMHTKADERWWCRQTGWNSTSLQARYSAQEMQLLTEN